MRKVRHVLSATAISAVAVGSLPAQGQQVLNWTGSTDSNLSTPGNWDLGIAPGSGATLVFSGAGAALTDDLGLSSSLTLNALKFSGNYSLSGQPLYLQPVWTPTAGGTVLDNVLSVSSGNVTIGTDVNVSQVTVNNQNTLLQNVYYNPRMSVAANSSLTVTGSLNLGTPNTPVGVSTADPNYDPDARLTINAGAGSVVNLGAVNGKGWAANLNGDTIAINGPMTVGALSASATTSLDFAQGIAIQGASSVPSRGGNVTLSSTNTTIGGPVSGVSILTLGGNTTINGGTVSANNVAVTGTLTLDNRANSAANFTNSATVSLSGSLTALGSNASGSPAPTSQTFGNLTIAGPSVIAVSGQTGQETLTFNSITNAPQTVGGPPSLVDYQIGPNGHVYYNTAPTAIGSSGILQNSTVWGGTRFASYSATNGVVEATTRNTLLGATAADNVYVSGSDSVANGSTVKLNSLALGGATVSGSGATIQLHTVGVPLLLTGTNSVAPAVDFGSTQGLIWASGNSTLTGGLSGTNGAVIQGGAQGAGDLTIGTSSISGLVSINGSRGLTTLHLAGADALTNAAVDSSAGSLDNGSNTQHLQSLTATTLLGSGAIIATAGDISITARGGLGNDLTASGTVYASTAQTAANQATFSGILSGTAGVSLQNAVSTGTVAATGAGGSVSIDSSTAANVQSTGSTFLNSGSITQAVSGTTSLQVTGQSALHGAGTFTGATTVGYGGTLTLDQAGSLANTSSIAVGDAAYGNGSLTLNYSNGASSQRLNSAAALTLTGSALSLANTGTAGISESLASISVARPTQSVTLGSSIALTNATLTAGSLSVASGTQLLLNLDANSHLFLTSAPTGVLSGVLMDKTIGSGSLQTFTAYSATNGVVDAGTLPGIDAGTLASAAAGSVVHVTSAGGAIGTATKALSGVILDTNQAIGGGALNVQDGLAVYQDGALVQSDVNFLGGKTRVSNVGTATLAGGLTGSFTKNGTGTVEITGNSASAIALDQGGVAIGGHGTQSGAVTIASASGGAAPTLVVQDSATLTGSVSGGTVSAIGNATINATVSGTLSASGSVAVGSKSIGTLIANGNGVQIAANANIGGLQLKGSAYTLGSAATIGSISTDAASSLGVLNSAKVLGYVSNGGTLANAGQIDNLDNYGTASNTGTVGVHPYGGYVTNGPSATLNNLGTINAYGGLTNNGTPAHGSVAAKGGTINNYAGSSLTVDSKGAGSGGFDNYGTINVAASSSLSIRESGTNYGALNNNGGTVLIAGKDSEGSALGIYSAPTGKAAGTLNQAGGTTQLDGYLQSNVNVSGGTLHGIGFIDGSVTQTGGTIKGGDSPGTLTIAGNLTTAAGSTLLFEDFGSQGADVLKVNGSLSLAQGTNVEFNLMGTGETAQSFFGNGAFNLYNYVQNGAAQTLNLSTSGLNILTDANGQYSDVAFNADGTVASITPTTAPVPLPAAVWLMLSGLGTMGMTLRRKRTTRQPGACPVLA